MRCSLSEWITCMSFLEVLKRARSLFSLSLSQQSRRTSRASSHVHPSYVWLSCTAGEVVPAATFPWDYGRHQIPEAPLGQEDHAAFSK